MSQNINVGDSLIQLGMAQIEEEIRLAVNSALPRDKCELPVIPFSANPFYLDWTRFNCDEYQSKEIIELTTWHKKR